jgi:alpha-L-arabinofuranosidase
MFVIAEGARPLPGRDAAYIKITDTYTTSTKKRVGLSTLNYGDSDKRRSEGFKPFKNVMQDMNPGILRFPGGIEASSYLWATAPSWEPTSHAPAFQSDSRWPNSVRSIVQDGKFVDAMNFDEFMNISQAVGADVAIVINFESMYTEDGPTKEFLIDTAVRWVRYCKEKVYKNVKYWEIGNETDMKSSYNGMTSNATLYGNDAKDFIIAMKNEDPSIVVGTNGFYREFVEEAFNAVGEYIDFFVIHEYPFYKFTDGYANFSNGDGNYGMKYREATEALDASTISQERKDNMFFMVTETSVIDWKVLEKGNGWMGNDVGHALAMFEMVGRLMSVEKVRGALVWTTHWVEKNITKEKEIFNILSETNEYNPIAYGILPWSKAGDGRMMQVDYDSNEIIVYALNNGTETIVMIVNKMVHPVSINLSLETQKPVAYSYVFNGNDTASKTMVVENLKPEIPSTLKELSITVIAFTNQ